MGWRTVSLVLVPLVLVGNDGAFARPVVDRGDTPYVYQASFAESVEWCSVATGIESSSGLVALKLPCRSDGSRVESWRLRTLLGKTSSVTVLWKASIEGMKREEEQEVTLERGEGTSTQTIEDLVTVQHGGYGRYRVSSTRGRR